MPGGQVLLDPRLRGVAPGLAMRARGFAPLGKGDAAIERHLPAFEFAHDLFERAQRVLETHFGNGGRRIAPGILVHGARALTARRAPVK